MSWVRVGPYIFCYLFTCRVNIIGGSERASQHIILDIFGAPPQTTPTWNLKNMWHLHPKKREKTTFYEKSHPCFSNHQLPSNMGIPIRRLPILPMGSAATLTGECDRQKLVGRSHPKVLGPGGAFSGLDSWNPRKWKGWMYLGESLTTNTNQQLAISWVFGRWFWDGIFRFENGLK